MNRQKLILSLLLVVLACSIAYSVLRAPKEQRVATLKYRPGVPVAARGARPSGGGGDDSSVHLACWTASCPDFPGFAATSSAPFFGRR